MNAIGKPRWDQPVATTCPKCGGSNITRFAIMPPDLHWLCHGCQERFMTKARPQIEGKETHED